ncbi:hypothetical protein [Pedobacter agri]|uniref:Uncharacterized protein n=1 Tax=Pedobacter agri TaxID=454586 RepID=A0A9X3DCY2_9SPHI|nr:hypothetical protein [Pedobacter agri]MCX3265104.1 hypothetical protein [Pedobacter agri]
MLDKLRAIFIEELIRYDDTWRILRKSTFVDLIITNYNEFENTTDQRKIVELFNNCIKITILNSFTNIDTDRNLVQIQASLGVHNSYLIDLYDLNIKKVKLKIDNNFLPKQTIANQIKYLKTLGTLDIDYDEDVFFIDLAINCFNKLELF